MNLTLLSPAPKTTLKDICSIRYIFPFVIIQRPNTLNGFLCNWCDSHGERVDKKANKCQIFRIVSGLDKVWN